MSEELPSSSAQALVAVERDAVARGLKASFDALDDDVLAAVGRAFASVTPRQALSVVGTMLGAAAGVALAPVSTVGASVVLVVVTVFSFLVGRRDLRATLVDQGLAPEVVDALVATATVIEVRRSSWRSGLLRRMRPRSEDFARFGRELVVAARARRER